MFVGQGVTIRNPPKKQTPRAMSSGTLQQAETSTRWRPCVFGTSELTALSSWQDSVHCQGMEKDPLDHLGAGGNGCHGQGTVNLNNYTLAGSSTKAFITGGTSRRGTYGSFPKQYCNVEICDVDGNVIKSGAGSNGLFFLESLRFPNKTRELLVLYPRLGIIAGV